MSLFRSSFFSILLVILFLLVKAGVLFGDAAKAQTDFEEGMRLEKEGKSQNALEKYRDAVREDIHHVRAHMAFQNLTKELEADYSKLLKNYEGKYNDFAEDALYNYIYGRAFALDGKMDKARQYFEKSVKIDPKCQWALNAMGSVCIVDGDPKKAMDFYNRSLEIDPHFSDGYFNRGKLYLGLFDRSRDKEDLLKALSDINDAITEFPHRPEMFDLRIRVYRNLINVFAETKYVGDIEKDLTALVELRPHQWKWYYDRAEHRAAVGKLVSSLEDCDRVIRLSSDYPPVYLLRGKVRLAVSKNKELSEAKAKDFIDKARLDFQTAVEKSPKDVKSHFEQGLFLLDIGETAKSLDCFNNALALEPEALGPLMNRGNAYCKMDKWQEGIADFSSVLKKDETHFGARLSRASAFQHLGDYAKAEEDLVWISEKTPNAKAALDALDAMYAEMSAKGQDVKEKWDAVRVKRLDLLMAVYDKSEMTKREAMVFAMCTSYKEQDDMMIPMFIERLLAVEKDPQIRLKVAQGLMYAERKEGLKFLRQMLKDDDFKTRSAALGGIAKLLGKEALPELIPFLDDEIRSVQRETLRLMKIVSGQDFGEDPKAWKDWWEKNK